ncbi:unnamed protein product [Fraxinus pennsylvanica]|uniref:Uncharacterized protein n=1 Tax=Fraxinus pennsylvanica TaxID=56036 RepID=A0AAD1YVA2_9LAMI|nr:unnamed protein product [Fraxinus pennsylvanica]
MRYLLHELFYSTAFVPLLHAHYSTGFLLPLQFFCLTFTNMISDWSVQATVSWTLSEAFGGQNISIVAEEDVQTLSKPESSAQLGMVVSAVNECLAEAPKFGLKGPNEALGASQVLEAINRCNSSGGPVGRHWVLDPVDGTLVFVHRDQYAIALALIDGGEVAIQFLAFVPIEVKIHELHKSQITSTGYKAAKWLTIEECDLSPIVFDFNSCILENMLSDDGGTPLDFSRGIYLEGKEVFGGVVH